MKPVKDNDFEIDWKDQCKYCTHGINTTHCFKNENFIKKLSNFLENELFDGKTEFACSYFCFDNYKFKDKLF